MKDNFLDLIATMPGQKIAVIGDLILDRYVWGRVERISAEAPVPVVEELRREDRLGGAANVVSNLRGLGIDVAVFGVCGNDGEGEILLDLLNKSQVDTVGFTIDDSRPTTAKLRILGGSQQMLRLDREQRHTISPQIEKQLAAALLANLDSYAAVVVSDYAKGVFGPNLVEAMQVAQARGKFVIIDPHPNNTQLYWGGSLIKPNQKEAEQSAGVKITDIASAAVAAKRLIELWGCKSVLITLGANGMVMCGEDLKEPLFLEAEARSVFDVSGAGDCVTAMIAACVSRTADWSLIGRLANIAAGIVISEVGTAPITKDKLLRRLAEEDLH